MKTESPPMKECELDSTWWQILIKPHTYELVLLIIAGLVLEGVIHYTLGIAIVYTHFYYLIIVIAGLWYGRKAVVIAAFFGVLHSGVTYLVSGMVSPDALARALMFCIVAFVVGTAAEQLRCYHDRLITQNRRLQELNDTMVATNQQRELTQISFEAANRKLSLLSSITRHDIRNQLTGLIGCLGLIRQQTRDPATLALLDKGDRAADNIVRQIEFTKNYEDLGVHAPQWLDVTRSISRHTATLSASKISISMNLNGIEVFADPLFEKVHENLIDNSVRHGERVRTITFSCLPYPHEVMAIVYEDDGIGIHEEDKERIFEKGFGKNTGLGLFLIREILGMTGITIKETGTYGKGARFEILLPRERYRFPPRPVTDTAHTS